MNPPRFPRALLERLLPQSERNAILGDLDEEFRCHVAPARGARSAALWYWRQCLMSIPAAVRLGARRGRPRRSPSSETRGTSLFTGLGRDIRYALTLARRRPGFTVSTVTIYALAVAVTTAVATLAYIVLLRPLPYGQPDRLVHLAETDRHRPDASGNFSYPDFVALRERVVTLDGIAGYTGGSRTLAVAGTVDRVPVTQVTAGFFETLGVTPLVGRAFDPQDSVSGAPPVVILGHGAWMHRFGGRATILGERVLLNGTPHSVVGVLPPSFEFAPRGLSELWLPVRPSQAQLERRYFHWLDVIARLRAGVTLDRAREDLAVVAQQAAVEDPQWHADTRLSLVPFRERIVGNVRPALLVLLAAVCLVLLGACASIAGLFIARWSGRMREVGIRSAMGASSRQLRRQLLVESLVLGIAGSAVGLAAGAWLLKLYAAMLPAQHRAALPHHDALALDLPAAASIVVFSMITAVMTGLVPAIRATRVDPSELLRSAGWLSPARDGRTRSLLVAVQVAFAAVLLVGAALLGRSTWYLLQVSPGFDPQSLLTLRLNLSGERYDTLAAVRDFHARVLERLAAVPGTLGAATITQLPLTGTGHTGTFSFAEGIVEPGIDPSVAIRTVSSNYFDVVGIPLIQGRAFAPTDRESSRRVVVVNQAFARRFSRGSDLLGRGVVFEFFAGRPRWEIVGVIGNERFEALDRPPAPVVYFPFGQDPGGSLSIVLRTAGNPAAVAAVAKAAVAEVDPALPVFLVRPMSLIIAESEPVFLRRQVLALLGLFGLAALIVSATGLYGVLAQLVAQQRREIGVRLALGATPGDVARLILARGGWPAVAGLVIGLAVALAAGKFLRALLFEISVVDPTSMIVVAAVLIASAIAACLLPTLRAVRLDPATVLKEG